MECLTAQQLISDALDREPADADQLSAAKSHCMGCPTCSVFVRAQLLVRNAPLPAPPSDLVDRVMDAVRIEDAASRQAAETAAAVRSAVAETVVAESSTSGPDQLGRDATGSAAAVAASRLSERTASQVARGSRLTAVRMWVDNLSPREFTVWASAAVLFVAVVGISSVAGVKVLTSEPPLNQPTSASDGQAGATADLSAAAPESALVTPSQQTSPQTTAGSYITVQGVVYKLSGPSTIATEGLSPAGTTVSALGSSNPPSSHSAFSADDPDRIYVTDDAKQQLLAFDRIVRTYGGRTYQLTSGELSSYGQWPSLPVSVASPTGDDGSPTFVLVAKTPPSTRIFQLATAGAEVGIGVAPGTGADDPAAGNPNWTWWIPTK